MYADGILLDELSFFFSFLFFYRTPCVCVCVKEGREGDLSISLHYCFLKSLVIHHIGRHLLQRTGNVHLIKETGGGKRGGNRFFGQTSVSC